MWKSIVLILIIERWFSILCRSTKWYSIKFLIIKSWRAKYFSYFDWFSCLVCEDFFDCLSFESQWISKIFHAKYSERDMDFHKSKCQFISFFKFLTFSNLLKPINTFVLILLYNIMYYITVHRTENNINSQSSIHEAANRIYALSFQTSFSIYWTMEFIWNLHDYDTCTKPWI